MDKHCIKGGIKTDGASCSFNNSCHYPSCLSGELRNISLAELLLMFTRLAIGIEENPENYVWGKNMNESVAEFFIQENYRRKLLIKEEDKNLGL